MEFFWGVRRAISEKETVIRRGSHKDLCGGPGGDVPGRGTTRAKAQKWE